MHILAVTHWFYGISDLIQKENVVLDTTKDRSKQLTLSDVEMFEETYHLGHKFISSASLLPFLPSQDFIRETKSFQVRRATGDSAAR